MAGNHVLLETVELTQAASSVTLDNIPQTGYTDLKVVISSRSSAGGSAWSDIIIKPNNSTSSINTQVLYGTGTAVAATTFTTGLPVVGEGNAGTSNTFGNAEIYISNYTSSNFKSFSTNSVSENNASSSLVQFGAMLWSNTSAITSLIFTDFSSGNFVAGSTFSLYGVAATGTTPASAPKATGGNIVANDGTYWYHAFLSSGTFTPQTALTCNLVAIAGGGGAMGGGSAGAGAGGLVYLTSQSLTATGYAVTVGAGGGGGPGDNAAPLATSGSNSQFGSLTAAVGGGYASRRTNGISGGSGSGAPSAGSSYSAGTGTAGQGNNGGSATTNYTGGGGGGAGAAGGNASTGQSGAGGAGVNTYSSWASATGTGVSGYYAGGGGAGGQNATGSSTYGAGGSGGGGNGATANALVGSNGTANTGGGAGGGWAGATDTYGGNGGSGIVIIRYAMV